MTRRRRRIRPIWILLAASLLLAGFVYTEQNWIQTETIEVISPRLPAAFDGLRIVQVSDLHGKSFGPDSRTLLAAVAALKPDLIAITGDLADFRAGQLDIIPALAAGLTQIAPTYYVTGNHEWSDGRVSDVIAILSAHGVVPLQNTYLTLERADQRIVLAGIDDPNGRADQKTPLELTTEIRAALGDPYILLLAHRNNKHAVYDACGVDVVLTGHAHGGLIRLPFTEGVIGPSRELWPVYTAGLYAFPHTQMVVSRGLAHGAWPQFRLFNRPHLPVIVLRKE